MKSFASCLICLILISGCSDNTTEASTENNDSATIKASGAQVNEIPIPADIDKKFNKIMDEFEHKISNDFWVKFTSTTRRGGKGTTEITFDQNAYEAFMAKKGFMQIPNTNMGYKGTVDSVDVSILHKTVSGEKGGWIQQWSIEEQISTDSGIFKKQRSFQSDPL